MEISLPIQCMWLLLCNQKCNLKGSAKPTFEPCILSWVSANFSFLLSNCSYLHIIFMKWLVPSGPITSSGPMHFRPMHQVGKCQSVWKRWCYVQIANGARHWPGVMHTILWPRLLCQSLFAQPSPPWLWLVTLVHGLSYNITLTA